MRRYNLIVVTSLYVIVYLAEVWGASFLCLEALSSSFALPALTQAGKDYCRLLRKEN